MIVFGQITALFLCLLAAAFFSGIETGVISINRLRLRHMVRHEVPSAAILEYFLKNPDYFLGTTLVGTNIGQVPASVMAAGIGAHAGGQVGLTVAAVLTALLILIFTEYLPKAWFQSSPTRRSLPFARALKWSALVLRPLSVGFSGIVRVCIPRGRSDAPAAQPFLTRDEILHLAREGTESGILTREENRMIHSVLQLRGKSCGDIMVPRDRMVCVNLDTPTEDLLNLARSTDVNRFPVYDPAQKTFVGILNIFDVLADFESGSKAAKHYMRPVQLVADHTPADHVLPRMRVTRQPMVLVTDERYEVIGLVTLADVLAEVVGEF